MQICDYFKDKVVVQMGLGLLGRGVGDAEFIAKCAPKKFIVTDLKTEDELKESVDALKDLNIEFIFGEHRVSDFRNADTVLKASGVPLDSEYINEAKRAGADILMSTAILAKYAQDMGVRVVGVTGTRGKSTTVQMIYDGLQKYRKDANVFLGGNVRGVSTLQLADKLKEGDILVLELDSWQLQGFGDLKVSPNIAVFTNFYEDHLNYYKNMDLYFADKANIFKFQSLNKGDLLIVSDEVLDRVSIANPPIEPMAVARIPQEWSLKVPGAHNRENASLALEALSELGLSTEEVKETLENFTGVEGRLEYLGEFDGVKIFNDNNATSPVATISALKALKDKGRILLVLGGSDKGLELNDLASCISSIASKVFLLAGSGTDKLKSLLNSYESEYSNLKDLMSSVKKQAQKGDIVLFSPAFASFGTFANEYERGDEFKRIVKDLWK